MINLLRAGYDNALQSKVQKLMNLSKNYAILKNYCCILDGDRAGGFILKELKSVVPIDYELRADNDVEVEELTPQEN